MFEQEQNRVRTSGRRASRPTIITASVLALALIAGASALIVRAQLMTNVAAATAAAVKTERVLVGIDGMHCGTCASGIKSMLKRTPGVVAAEVSFEQKQANVEFDPAATSREKIVEAINNMGYKASVKG